MDSSSDDDSWSTVESSEWLDDSELECSTCSSSDDEDCSYRRQESQNSRIDTTSAVKKPPFLRANTFVLKEKVANDLEEGYYELYGDVLAHGFSSSSCSSGSDEEEDSSQEWTSTDTRQNFPFTATPALNTGDAETPLDFFYLLFNRGFVQFLADSINERGKEFAQRFNKTFSPTDVEEVYTVLCTYFMMGFANCISEDISWGHRPSLNVDFNTYVRKERYILLFGLLTHRETGSDTPADYRSWYEVAVPIADKFNAIMKDLMVPGKELNLSTETVLYFNESNELLRRPERIRMHLLSNNNGIFQRVFLVDPVLQEEIRGETIARTLMDDFLDCGRSLYCNTFYSSIRIAEDLLGRKTYLTSVLKKNRPGNPAFLRMKPSSSKMPVRTIIRDLRDEKMKEKGNGTEDDKTPNWNKKQKLPSKEIKIVHGFNTKGVCVCKIVIPHMKFNMISTEFTAKPAVDKKSECEMLGESMKHLNMYKRDKLLSKCGIPLPRKNNRHVAYLIQAMCMNAYLMLKVKTGKKIKFVKFLEEILYQMLPLDLEAISKDKEKNKGNKTKKPTNRNRARGEGPHECILN